MYRKIIWIGTYADSDYMKKLGDDTYVQFAANRVQGYYINSLINQGLLVDILSALVTIPFPKSHLKRIPFHISTIKKDVKVWNVSFLNLKYLSILSQTRSLLKSVKQQEKSFDNSLVIVYSMRIPYLKLARMIKKKYQNVTVVNIVPDLPEYMSTESGLLRKILVKINKGILLKEQRIVDGFVLYSRAMSEVLNIKKEKYVVIEGIVPYTKWVSFESEENSPRICVYAGGVYEQYGVRELVEGFIMANIPNTELHIYGLGDYVEKIRKISIDNPKIKYMGCVDSDKAFQVMCKADLLINPRSTKEDFTKYSCPSKIFEYMLSGTPTAITRLEGIPEEYFDYVYEIEESTKEGIAKALTQVFNESKEQRECKAISARRFIIDNKNENVQVKRLLDFANTLSSNEDCL